MTISRDTYQLVLRLLLAWDDLLRVERRELDQPTESAACIAMVRTGNGDYLLELM